MSNAIFNDPDMQEIFEGFIIETNEILETISGDLMILENNSSDLDLLNKIFRSFHTIKGTASFMGFDSIVKITHQAEDLLNKLRKQELTVNRFIIDVLLEVHDWINLLMSNLIAGMDEPVDYSETMEQLELLKQGINPNDVKKVETKPIEEKPIKEPKTTKKSKKVSPKSTITVEKVESADNPVDYVLNNRDMFAPGGDFTEDELALLEAAFQANNKVVNEQNTDKNADFFNSLIQKEASKSSESSLVVNEDNDSLDISQNSQPEKTLQTNTQDKLNSDKNPQKNAQTASKNISSETIRVDVERVEALLDLSGELVLGRNRLSQISENLENEVSNKDRIRDLIETTAQIDFITSEIQAAVMRMRMVPIGKLFQKAPRIVRDLSKEFNKKIVLHLSGEETEIDRGIIEELNDPLVHMIRNSCDHGIENENERTSSGKSETGTINLDADQEGNNIVIRISDDGKGMDPEKLKAKALEKGIITEEQAMNMTKREAFQLVFLPGFSTAKVVSSVSGRGVGMDVVRTNIQKLKGIIEIDSEFGIGTTFIIKLPLTLAIIQGLLIKAHKEIYAIPLSSVIEVVSIETENVYSIKQREVIRIREDVLPLIRLDKILKSKIYNDSLKNRYVVVVGTGIHRVGLVVDELLGQQEIVIKSLGEYLGHIQGMAGSTILGDGSVIMIIDVAELITLSSV